MSKSAGTREIAATTRRAPLQRSLLPTTNDLALHTREGEIATAYRRLSRALNHHDTHRRASLTGAGEARQPSEYHTAEQPEEPRREIVAHGQ